MPIDPRIALGVQPVQTPNPLETLQALTQIQGLREQSEARRLAADKARQAAADEAAIRRVLTATGGDMEQALPQLRQIAPEAALKFETEMATRREKAATAIKTEFENRTNQFTFGLKVAQDVHDDASLAVARPMILSISPQLDPIMPKTYDPTTWQAFMNVGKTAKDLHDERAADLKDFLGGDHVKGLGGILSRSRNQQEWDNGLMGAKALGGSQALLDTFGPTFSPENAARAGQLAIAPKEAEELAGQKETRAETAARDAATQATAAANLRLAGGHLAVSQAAERRQAANPELVQVFQDGKAVWVPKAQAIGQPAAGGAAGRPATGAERQALAYYNRAQEATDTLTTPDPTTGRSLEDSVSGVETKLANVPIIGNYLQSTAAQTYTQAQRAFTEARLRKESGARINESEYENDRRTYFKQPGDSPAVVEQKRLAREKVLNGLAFSSGKAYEEYYGQPFTRETGTTPPAGAAASAKPAAARIGERRTIQGQLAEWDGKGWKPVQ